MMYGRLRPMSEAEFNAIPPELGGPTAKEKLEAEALRVGTELDVDLDVEAQATELEKYVELRDLALRQVELERKESWWLRLLRRIV